MEKASIILPTYNGTKHIKQSIKSCLGQTYNNLELIIVDDGSSAEILNIVDSFSDSRIKYIRHEKNKGLAEALNTGFSNSSGQYLTWTSDDNFYAPDAIKIMAKKLQENDKIDFVYANYYLVDDAGKMLRRVVPGSIKTMDMNNCIGACFLYKRKVYEKIGGYNSDFYLAEDYEYWLRIREKFNMVKLENFLYYYRQHKGSLSLSNKLSKIEEQAEKASSKYVRPSMRFYHRGKIFFYQKKYFLAQKFFIKSFLLEPFNIYIWRFMVFTLFCMFAPLFAEKIIKIKNRLIL
ncbi:MAG: glycosyltransferase [Candidatus Staskawiczbacteria bacterium]|jgi:glycosyltransferase involved in cell wall biosynthesis